jgi:hypothetical protein
MTTAAVLIKEELAISSLKPLTAMPVVPNTSDVGPYRQWNPSAVACYLRQADCDGCFYNQFFQDKAYGCNMAEAVNYLLKQVGPPDKRRIQRLV